ncbi:hypothetical protein M433DRAFT_157550 [Acidomyces richmondensis BFW]|nr:hypothetical protein M433DRAFT_157550 [Acidomyces richmondensis BFW]
MFKNRDTPLPGPTYMSDEQKAAYLKGLRSHQASRPSGSRPPPPSKFASLRRSETLPFELRRQSSDGRPALPLSSSMPIVPAEEPKASHRRAESDFRIRSPFAGRPLVRPPSAESTNSSEASSKSANDARKRVSMPYMENGTRWMEKQEVRSLRMALEDMDQAEEKRLHSAAQDEAAELVWKHQNPEAAEAKAEAPYANPDIRRDYRSHLRKGSYQRSHSQDQVPLIESRKASGSSHESVSERPMSKMSADTQRTVVGPSYSTTIMQKTRTPSGKSYGDLAEAVRNDIAMAQRRVSSGSKRIMSGEKKFYMHPNDKIYEDPPPEPVLKPKKVEFVEEPAKPAATPIQPPPYIRKNPFARVRMQQDRVAHSTSAPVVPVVAKHDSIEIQRNPPSQSRKAWYTSNEPVKSTPPASRDSMGTEEGSPTGTPTKDGKEVRSDDIRAATSKQRKDRSPKLPQPTVVSNKPGRPIVSFQQDWKPKEVVLEEMHGSRPPEPTKSNAATGIKPAVLPAPKFNPPPLVIPQMNIPNMNVGNAAVPAIPKISLPDDPPVPAIVFPDDSSHNVDSAPITPSINVEPTSRPSMNVNGPNQHGNSSLQSAQKPSDAARRPRPSHVASSPLPRSTPHYTPSVRQFGILCAHCALPIAGRILSAAGERFHPDCFVCHQCHTNLEHVAFYPEPEKQRSERIERIHARRAGKDIPIKEGMTAEDVLQQEFDDGDECLRFYCHLDFHELFSPRCKSCKTPIEGEVIVACGAEWHAGHFFCAQCGDPFDARTPFVEKDGYAWCVGCHTNRYSPKCRKCKKPVTDIVVKALGWDWHSKCFVCTECNGDFEDGKYFLRGESENPVCVKCEERRLKA